MEATITLGKENSNHSGSSGDRCVTVKAGDTIWSLCEMVYGSGQHPLAAIYEDNHLPVRVNLIEGKRQFVAPVIKAGEKLLFPAPSRISSLQQEFFHNLEHNSSSDQKEQRNVAPFAKGKPDIHVPSPGAPSEKPQVPNVATEKPKSGNVPSEKPQSHSTPVNKPTSEPNLGTRIGNVAAVVTDGLVVGTLKEGVKQSWQDPLGTAERAAAALALGVGFGIATGGVGFVAEAAGLVGLGLTITGAFDFLNPVDKKNAVRNANISKCLNTAWNANDQKTIESCNVAMEKELGRPGFDFLLSTAGGLAGGRCARSFMPSRVLTSTQTGLARIEPSTDLVSQRPSVTIVAHDTPMQRGPGPQSHGEPVIVDAVSVKVLPSEDVKRIETTQGGSKALEDSSLRSTVPLVSDDDRQ